MVVATNEGESEEKYQVNNYYRYLDWPKIEVTWFAGIHF